MAQEIQDATPGALAGDGAEAIAVGTLTGGQVAVVTGQETVAPSAGGGAAEAQPHALVRVSFAVDALPAGTTFTVTQVGTPALATTVTNTPTGFDIVPSAQPAPNTLYAFTYA